MSTPPTDAQAVVEPTNEEAEFVFFSGKGGVGKSTVSCATATWLADNDYETLLVTTDPAPNLSDIFGQDIGHEVTAIDDIEKLFSHRNRSGHCRRGVPATDDRADATVARRRATRNSRRATQQPMYRRDRRLRQLRRIHR